MRYTNNFVIHTTEQLIDINKSLRNFNATMTITSENEDDDFDIVIVTQKQLDDTNFTLNYKKISHYISINVKSNKQEVNDYVLVIKSNKKVKVEIVINITNLDEDVEDVEEIEDINDDIDVMSDVGIDNDDIISDVDINDVNTDITDTMGEVEDIIEKYRDEGGDDEGNKSVVKGGYKKYLKYLLILLVVGICIFFLFFTNSTEKKGKKKLKIESDNILDTVEPIKSASPPKTEIPKKSKSRSTKINKETSGNESLLEQLRRIREN
jgi:hypothetical protein